MNTEFEHNLTDEPVLVVTDDDLIEGTICYHKNVRLSDAMKSPASLNNPYLALANATVTRRATGQQVIRTRFLLVTRSRITALMPKSEVLTQCDPTANPAQHAAKTST